MVKGIMGRKSKQKKQNPIVQSDNILSSNEKITDEIPVSKYHDILVSKIVKICDKLGITIFGSYVREYLCERPFNYEVSDIDIFSCKYDLSSLTRAFTKESIRVCVDKNKGTKYSRMDEDEDEDEDLFSVTHMILGLQNDELFTGKKIEIKIDFVKTERKLMAPPFNNLDFVSNAFIWDKSGIRLSRQTGTDIDKLSAREIKQREGSIIADANNKITSYVPLNSPSSDPMSSRNIYWRKTRISRISKMLKQGWHIKNIPCIKQVPHSDDVSCLVCQDIIDGPSLKMTCCTSHYHHDCFVQYSCSELDDRTFIRCTQRCSELHL